MLQLMLHNFNKFGIKEMAYNLLSHILKKKNNTFE